MKIELISSEQLESTGMKMWYIVIVDGFRKHFHSMPDAQKYYDETVAFHKKHGKITPNEVVFKSEEI